MNVSSRATLTHEFEVPFFSTDDPRFSWLKYQILKCFEDWLTTIEIRPGIYEKSENQKNV